MTQILWPLLLNRNTDAEHRTMRVGVELFSGDSDGVNLFFATYFYLLLDFVTAFTKQLLNSYYFSVNFYIW